MGFQRRKQKEDEVSLVTGLFEERPCNEDNNLLVIFFYKVKIRRNKLKKLLYFCVFYFLVTAVVVIAARVVCKRGKTSIVPTNDQYNLYERNDHRARSAACLSVGKRSSK